MNDSNVTERVRRYWVDRKMGNMKIVGFLQFVLVGKKYDDFIFYLFPFYHVLLPSINKLIVLDFDTGKHIGHYCSTFFKNTFSSKFANVQSKKNLSVFKVDPSLLHQEFSKFNDSHVLGMGIDLNLQYHHKLSRYVYHQEN